MSAVQSHDSSIEAKKNSAMNVNIKTRNGQMKTQRTDVPITNIGAFLLSYSRSLISGVSSAASAPNAARVATCLSSLSTSDTWELGNQSDFLKSAGMHISGETLFKKCLFWVPP